MEKLTLTTIAGGAVDELFQRELDQVMTNIDDPNTDAEAVRKITIQVELKPSKSRDMTAIHVAVASKQAPISRVSTIGFIGRAGGKCVLLAAGQDQPGLFEPAGKPAPVVSIVPPER